MSESLMPNNHKPRYEMPTEAELASMPATDRDKLEESLRVDKESAIRRLQAIINAFPWGSPKTVPGYGETEWNFLNLESPNLPITGKLDVATINALNSLYQVGEELNEPHLAKMKAAVDSGDFFTAQSEAYIAKTLLSKALHQYQKFPKELQDKYPGLRRWTIDEIKEHLHNSPYPRYFPKPWDISRFGKRNWDGTFGCTGKNCEPSYYENFLSWGPPNKQGVGIAYDPRLLRNMDKYPNIWSTKAIRYRMNNNIPSPYIPSPGTGEWIDPNNPPEGKYFLDAEDKNWYFKLLDLYKKFVQEEQTRGSSYIMPHSTSKVALVAIKFIK